MDQSLPRRRRRPPRPPRLYGILIAGYLPAIYEGQLKTNKGQLRGDLNIAETPLTSRFLTDLIVSHLDELNLGTPVPDEVAAEVTSAGEDRHPTVLNQVEKFTYNPVTPAAKMVQVPGQARSGTKQHPNLVKLARASVPTVRFAAGVASLTRGRGFAGGAMKPSSSA